MTLSVPAHSPTANGVIAAIWIGDWAFHIGVVAMGGPVIANQAVAINARGIQAGITTASP